MVHLCVSISDDGPRLEYVQQRLPESVQRRGNKAREMATLQRRPNSRTGPTRLSRSSCSSTASCPVFSGSYSDHEEEPPLRRQSSPLLKGSLSSLHSSSVTSPKGSLSSLQRSVPCLQESLSGLQGSLSRFQCPSLNHGGTASQLKRFSLNSLDDSSPRERSISPSLLNQNASSSDDDGSWDTNSWGSGATCLLRTPVKQDINDVSTQTFETAYMDAQGTSAARLEDEIIYQNLIFTLPEGKGEKKSEGVPKRTCTAPRKDAGTQITSSFQEQKDKTEDKRKFSQFLNEVTSRVLNSNGGFPQPTVVRHRYSSLRPPPMSTPPHPSLHAARTNPLSPSTLAAKSWCSPTNLKLITSAKQDTADITNSIHQWSKTLPSCKVLDPVDVLKEVKRESCSYTELGQEICLQIQAQPSTGRLYLETDIDRVRELDELIASAILGKEKNETGFQKGVETGKERKDRVSWERHGALKTQKGEEKELRILEKGVAAEQDKEKNKEKETPCWETEKRREKGKRMLVSSFGPLHPKLALSDEANQFSSWPDRVPRISYTSTSLTRPVNNTASDGETPLDTSSFLDHKDDLCKRLSYTTHKLEMVETEFDPTRHYLETELQLVQEELEKFTGKLHRIQRSYEALQRSNQNLEDKMHRMSRHHEEEKRALSHKIIVLNNHLIEAKITISKLKGDNECLLEKTSGGGSATSVAVCHSDHPDAAPKTITAKVLEKPKPGSSCPVTRSPSPQLKDGSFVTSRGSTDRLNRLIAYKTSDLYCSDTALYSPERWQDLEQRQGVDLQVAGLLQHQSQNLIDGSPDEEPFHSGRFSHRKAPSSFHLQEEFNTNSLPSPSTYTSFNLRSDKKGGMSDGCVNTVSSNLLSSQQGLYTEWQAGNTRDHIENNLPSFKKDSSCFPKSHSIQLLVAPKSSQKCSSPLYTRTTSYFRDPYHSSTPHLGFSPSTGSTPGLTQGYRGALGDVYDPEDELSICWRKLSVEDINAFSSSYHDITDQVSPFSFPGQHIAAGPPREVKGSVYSGSHEGDHIFQDRTLNHCFTVGSPLHSCKPIERLMQDKPAVLYQVQNNSQDHECSLLFSGNSKEEYSSGGAAAANQSKKNYVKLSTNNSVKSLQQSSLDTSGLKHNPRPAIQPHPNFSAALGVGPVLPKKTSSRHQKFVSTGLTRKDSLTKAQLYGTLLN